MPAATTTTKQQASLEAQQHELEAVTMQAIAAGLARYAQWRSLQNSAARAGVPMSAVLPGALIAKNQTADRQLATIVQAVAALENGTGYLQRYRVGAGPVQWGIARARPALGQAWPAVAMRVLKHAGQAALLAFGWHLTDVFGAAKQTANEATKLRAENTGTCQNTAQQLIAAGKTADGTALAAACAQADAAAAKPEPGLMDQLKTAAIDVAKAGAFGGGALLALGLLYFLGRGKVRSPVTFHKPVSFHKPIRFRSARA